MPNNEDSTLGLKVGNHRENLLTQIKDATIARIESQEISLEIDRVVMGYLEQEISKEKVKFQSQLNESEVKQDGE